MVIAIRSTAIGAFTSRAKAEQAVCDLLVGAFGSDQVGIVLPDAMAAAAGSAEAGPMALWAGSMFRSLIGVDIPDYEVRSGDPPAGPRTGDGSSGEPVSRSDRPPLPLRRKVPGRVLSHAPPGSADLQPHSRSAAGKAEVFPV